jgi:hypothetical protein
VTPPKEGPEIFGERYLAIDLMCGGQRRGAKDRRSPLHIISCHDVDRFGHVLRGTENEPKQVLREIHGRGWVTLMESARGRRRLRNFRIELADFCGGGVLEGEAERLVTQRMGQSSSARAAIGERRSISRPTRRRPEIRNLESKMNKPRRPRGDGVRHR